MARLLAVRGISSSPHLAWRVKQTGGLHIFLSAYISSFGYTADLVKNHVR
jgi:hypothetical protein